MLRKLFLLLASIVPAPLIAQDCAHQVIERVESKVTVGQTQKCGTLQFNFGHLRLGNIVNGCPQWVLIEPPHDTTKAKPGSNSETRPTSREPVSLLRFTCVYDHVFWIIPVEASCSHVDTKATSSVTNYVQYGCGQTEPARNL